MGASGFLIIEIGREGRAPVGGGLGRGILRARSRARENTEPVGEGVVDFRGDDTSDRDAGDAESDDDDDSVRSTWTEPPGDAGRGLMAGLFPDSCRGAGEATPRLSATLEVGDAVDDSGVGRARFQCGTNFWPAFSESPTCEVWRGGKVILFGLVARGISKLPVFLAPGLGSGRGGEIDGRELYSVMVLCRAKTAGNACDERCIDNDDAGR